MVQLKLIDVHCHLTWPSLKENVDEILKRSISKGLKAVVVNTVNYQDFLEALSLKEKLQKLFDLKIYVFAGLYPNEIKEDWQEQIERFEKLLEEQKAQGLGEVGMDRSKYTTQDEELQRKVFSEIVKIAKKHNVVLNVHSRGMQKQVLEVLESFNHKKVILHYFEAKQSLVDKAIEQGHYLTVPSNIYKARALHYNVEKAPLNRLLTETDSPFLKPLKELKQNEPWTVEYALRFFAEKKQLSVEEASNIVLQNFLELFS